MRFSLVFKCKRVHIYGDIESFVSAIKPAQLVSQSSFSHAFDGRTTDLLLSRKKLCIICICLVGYANASAQIVVPFLSPSDEQAQHFVASIAVADNTTKSGSWRTNREKQCAWRTVSDQHTFFIRTPIWQVFMCAVHYFYCFSFPFQLSCFGFYCFAPHSQPRFSRRDRQKKTIMAQCKFYLIIIWLACVRLCVCVCTVHAITYIRQCGN